MSRRGRRPPPEPTVEVRWVKAGERHSFKDLLVVLNGLAEDPAQRLLGMNLADPASASACSGAPHAS